MKTCRNCKHLKWGFDNKRVCDIDEEVVDERYLDVDAKGCDDWEQ